MTKSSQAFRTIREVAEWLGVATHVLRFWESRFPQIKPVKRAGGRRYYRPSDMALIGGIKVLLHDRGLTIRGVQRMMRESGLAAVAALSPPLDLELEAELAGDLSEAWGEEPVEDVILREAAQVPAAARPTSPDSPAQPGLTPDAPDEAAPTPETDAETDAEAETVAPAEAPRPEAPAWAPVAARAERAPMVSLGKSLARLGALAADPAHLPPAARARLRPALVALRDRMRA